MKKLLITTVAFLAVLFLVPLAQAQDTSTLYPPFVQESIDSCGGSPIAWGEVYYSNWEGSQIWFCYNLDGNVIIVVDGIVPSDIRQNLQVIQGDTKKTGWKTQIDPKERVTLVETATYTSLCKDDICTNKKVIKAIQDRTKDTGLTFAVTDYFD